MTAESLLLVTKPDKGEWNPAVVLFITRHNGAFFSPYPSRAAVLRAADAGHAEAYRRAIRAYVPEYSVQIYSDNSTQTDTHTTN